MVERSTIRPGAPSLDVFERQPRENAANPAPLKPIFAVGGLYTEGSGVARIVCDLANALSRHGAPIDVYTALCQGQQAAEHLLAPPNRCITAPGRWLGRLAWSPALRRMLHEAMPQADLVHIHSLWMLPNRYAAQAAFACGKPAIFTAHGFLEPWALARSRWKKRLAGAWFQNRDLRRAACIHVNSRAEAAGVRAYGLRNPVAVVPNGVDLRPFERLPAKDAFLEKFPHLADCKICLFLSRLHAKKGLGRLIQGWKRLAVQFDDWRLVIAGPDDGYERPLRQAIRELDLKDSVTLVGPQYGEEKLAALAAAQAFVLPSFSEGFSMAVLEAMAAGLPVAITPGCNFPEAAAAGAGIEIPPTIEGIECGLRRLLALPEDERRAMGRRARDLIESHYTWDRIARQMLRLYRWAAGGGAPPEFVAMA